MYEFIFDKIRIMFLTRNIVRLERMRKGKFCDSNTFFVPDRTAFEGWDGASLEEDEGVRRIVFGAFTLVVPAEGKSLAGIRLERAGRIVWRYKRLANTGELPLPGDTPEVFAVSDMPRILLPQGGYASSDRKTGGYRIDERAEDVYLLLCEKNARLLRRLYVALTGRCELVRLSTLGYWDSRYFAYDEEGAKQRILDYEAHDVPLDNIVIDTDWRAASDRGIGYDVNTKLFPDIQGYFGFAHAHGVEVMFNDHPEPVEGAKDLFDPAEVKYREEKLQGLMELGLDTWWYDRNWHTKLISPTPNVRPETFGMYLFEEITRNFYRKKAGRRGACRRPVIMGNVNNVQNGMYTGEGDCRILDSASHRYSIQWTGDIASDYSAIGREVESLVRAGANCIPYINSDCGGHTGNPDNQTYLRWIQFGAFSPVLRPHCSNGVSRTREPWAYDKETLAIAREYIRLRYRLLPLIYSLAHESYGTGIPMFRALGFEYPEDRRACRETSEYLLGKELLIAPIARYEQRPETAGLRSEIGFLPEARDVYLPKGRWINVFTGKAYAGSRAHVVPCPVEQMPLFVREGALVPVAPDAQNTKQQFWNRLAFDYFPSEEAYCKGALAEDDGETTAYQDGEMRTCGYFSRFDRVENCYAVTFEAADGSFAGERACLQREILLRVHLSAGRILRVRVNGKDAPYTVRKRDRSAFPFRFDGAAPDSDMAEIGVGFDVLKGAEVRIYCK